MFVVLICVLYVLTLINVQNVLKEHTFIKIFACNLVLQPHMQILIRIVFLVLLGAVTVAGNAVVRWVNTIIMDAEIYAQQIPIILVSVNNVQQIATIA